jgi:hypothetical protein
LLASRSASSQYIVQVFVPRFMRISAVSTSSLPSLINRGAWVGSSRRLMMRSNLAIPSVYASNGHGYRLLLTVGE